MFSDVYVLNKSESEPESELSNAGACLPHSSPIHVQASTVLTRKTKESTRRGNTEYKKQACQQMGRPAA